jgi:hypothetical protein
MNASAARADYSVIYEMQFATARNAPILIKRAS